MQIKIKGEIGWDVFFSDIERQLKYADGDIEVLIDTPGGGVYEGISIYNAIKDYSRGKVKVRVTGLACSMGSYIMLTGKLPGNELIFEPNSVVMIHNPAGGIWGDYRDIQSYSQLLLKLTDLFRNKYVETSNLSYDEITKMMDVTTYFIGRDELKTWGTVLETEKQDDVLDADILKASAVERMNSLKAKMTKEVVKADFDKVLQMSAGDFLGMSNINQVQSFTQSIITNQQQEEKMDLNELKAKYPDIYAQVKSEGYKEGVKAGCAEERKRVEDHLRFYDVAKNEAEAAIKEGKSFADMMSAYTHKQICANTIQTMQTNSPAAINTDDPTKPDSDNPQDAANRAEIETALKVRGLMGEDK